jgi:hypothetical protein
MKYVLAPLVGVAILVLFFVGITLAVNGNLTGLLAAMAIVTALSLVGASVWVTQARANRRT